MVHGLPFVKHVDEIYENSILGKKHWDAFPKGQVKRATRPIELVHAHVCRPLGTPFLNDSKCLLYIFMDDLSRITWVHFAKEKSKALPIFNKFKNHIKKHDTFSLRIMWIDHAGEFVSNEFDKFVKNLTFGGNWQLAILLNKME